MDDSEIVSVLASYPDLCATALTRWKTATLERKRVGSKLYLDFKAEAAGEKITVKELEMMVEKNNDYYKACLEEIMAEADHMRCYEKLMAAKKMASLRAAF